MNNYQIKGTASIIGIPKRNTVAMRTHVTMQSTNCLMTIPSIETNTSYNYKCPFCGNEFTLHYECQPDYCQSCRLYVSFIVEKKVAEITIEKQYCPICNQYFKTSEYLNSLFKNDDKARWLANMVMHHRHDHITSWNSNWSRKGYARNYLNVDYEEEKRKVNERAKRQIVRKCKDYMIQNGFTAEIVLKLQRSEQKTIDLYKRLLPMEFKINNNSNLK